MDIPVIIVPLPNRQGYAARLVAPFDLCAEAPTADEAQALLTTLLQERMAQGVELRSIQVGPTPRRMTAGWLPNDELTQEWLGHIQAYRAECDEADRKELEELERGEAA